MASNLERNIATCYLFLLPIRMLFPLTEITKFLPGATVYVDCILNAIGILLIISARDTFIYKKANSNLFKYFVLMILYFNISSIIMSMIIQSLYGNKGNETAFHGSIGMIIYFFQYIAIVLYNRHISNFFSHEQLLRIFDRVCFYLLLIGYIQLVVIFFPVLAYVYDKIDFFEILPNYRMISHKLALTGTEGASVGTIVGAFVFPYKLGCTLYRKSYRKREIFELLLWLPVLYYTRSTFCYFAIIINLIVAFLFSRKKTIILLYSGLCVASFVLFGSLFINNVEREEFMYNLTEKSFDSDNGSRASRIAPFYVNYEAFQNFPVFGVGNGLQGYYDYAIPHSILNTRGSDIGAFLSKSRNEIRNGALFFPSLLSGYGIVGAFLFLIFLVRLCQLSIKEKEHLGVFHYMFFIAFPSILLNGFQGDFYGNYIIWFAFSIPFMNLKASNYIKPFSIQNNVTISQLNISKNNEKAL